MSTISQAPTTSAPLGTFVHARSGDKGGDANLGLWVVNDGSPQRDSRVRWLLDLVTPAYIRALLPETADLDIEVHPLPNLGGVNVVIHGLLGAGVAASTRFDPQAKALGEWARARHVDIPTGLLDAPPHAGGIPQPCNCKVVGRSSAGNTAPEDSP